MAFHQGTEPCAKQFELRPSYCMTEQGSAEVSLSYILAEAILGLAKIQSP